MAEETRNADVRLSANVDPYVTSVNKAAKETDALGKTIDTLQGKFDKLQKVAGKKLVLFGGATIAGIGGITKQAADFEKQMSTLQATAVLTDKKMSGFDKQITQLGKNLPITNKAAIELVTTLDKMGVSTTRKIGEISASMVKLQAATGESLGGLTSGMADLGRQMGTLAAGSMNQYANALVNVSKQAGVSAEGVLSFAGAIAQSARAAGMTEQQVIGIAGAFQRAGADGYAAANVFNQMLNDISQMIATGSPELSKYADVVGKTSDQFAKMDKAEAVVQIFEQINKQGKDGIKTLNQLGIDGVRSLSQVQKVVQAGGLRQALGLATGGPNDALENSSKAAMDGLSDSATKLTSSLQRLGVTAGGPFVQMFTPAVDMMAKMTQAVEPLAKLLAGVGAAMSTVLGPGVAALGATLLASRVRSTITAARFLGGSAPVQGLRQGMAVGRGLARGDTVVNDFSKAAAANQLRWWQRPFFQAGVGFGQAQGPGGGPSLVGRALASPIRLSTTLVDAQREFVANARRGALDRNAPILGGLGTNSAAILNAARHPIDFARGFGTQVGETTLSERGQRLASLADRRYLSRGMQVPEGLSKAMAAEQAAAARATVENTATTAANTKVKQAEATAGRQLAAATGGLVKAFLRLEASSLATTAGGIGRAGVAGTKAVLGGALGLVGGPIGAAVLGAGFLGMSAYSDQKSVKNFESDRTGSVDAYTVALGGATTELGSFSLALKNAQANLPQPKDFGDLSTISKAVLDLAHTPNRELVNKDVKAFSSPKEIASWLSSMNFTDPKQLQLAQADIVQTVGQQTAQQAMDLFNQRGGVGQAVDFSGILKAAGDANKSGVMGNVKNFLLSTGNDKGMAVVSNAADDIDQRFGANQDKFGSEFARKESYNEYLQLVAAAAKNDEVNHSTATTATMNEVVQLFEKKALGSGADLDISTEWLTKNAKKAGVDPTDSKAFMDWFAKQVNSKVGTDKFGQPIGFTAQSDLAALARSEESPTVQARRRSGAVGSALVDNQDVQTALSRTGDVNAQYKGTIALLDSAKKAAGGMGTAFADIAKELAKAKAVVPVNGAEFNLISAAQQMNASRQAQQAPLMSREQNLNLAAKNYRNVMSGPQGSDFEQQRAAAEQQLMDARNQQFDYMKQLFLAHKNFGIQMKRQQEDRDISLARDAEDFQLQMKQSEDDYLHSRLLSQQDFTRQMERQGKEQAKAIFDPWKRMYSEYTVDAGTLLQNLTDQNQRIQQQQKDLQTVSKAGLSDDAIKTLNLSDSSQQQNLQRITQDIANDPSLAESINKQVATRLKETPKLTQNARFNDSFANAQEDFDRSMKEQEFQYNKMVDRSTKAHDKALGRMSEDFDRQSTRAKEDLARLGEQVFGSFGGLMDKTIKIIGDNIGGLGDSTIAELKRVGEKIPEFLDSFDEFYSRVATGQVLTGDTTVNASQGTSETGGTRPAPNYAGKLKGNRMMAMGGIVTKRTDLTAGEHGPEGIIPLNSHGHDFLAGMYQDITKQLVRSMGTIPSQVAYSGTSGVASVDASTNFNGPITVQASDPDKMARELKEKSRLKQLTRPSMPALTG